MNRPATRYAWNGENALAYQVVGDRPVDLVYMQGFSSNVELYWDHPASARFLRELSRFSRLIVTDRRGLGCSERFTPVDIPTMETLVEDVLAVLESVHAERPVIFATGDCVFIAALFAATHPEHLSGLVLMGGSPSWRRSDEIPWGQTDAELAEGDRFACEHFDGRWTLKANPSLAASRSKEEWARYERLTLSPGGCYADARRFGQTDIRGVLPSIQVPTLVLHRSDDPMEPVESGGFLASRIRVGRFVELPGVDHFPWAGDLDSVVREIEAFVGALLEEEAELDSVLATVMFTDLVGSTHQAAEVGDRVWQGILDRHHAAVRGLLARYRGAEIDTAGDGFFASFDGPARAARCAQAIVDAVKPLGLEVRIGLHTGEVHRVDNKVGGLAVAIGARVGGIAGASEILATQTVKDLVAGSGIVFEDRGLYSLKGIPDRWRLYAVKA